MALIESDTFLELVWDCYAWAVWQFIQVRRAMGHTKASQEHGITTPAISRCGAGLMKLFHTSGGNSKMSWSWVCED